MGVKQIKKNLMLGNKWTSYLIENEGKVSDRKGINKIASRFYRKLYADRGKGKNVDETGNDVEREPALHYG